MAAGLAMSFAVTLIAGAMYWVWRPARVAVGSALIWTAWFSVIAVGVLAHGAIAATLHAGFDTARFLSSYVLLVLMLLSATLFVLEGRLLSESDVRRLVDIALFVLIANAFIGLLGVRIFPYSSHKPVGLFSEPSHFALVLAPFLAFKCASKSRYHLWLLALFFGWGIAVENLTTLLVVALSLLLTIRLRLSHMLLIAILILSGILPNSEYFMSRLLISSESDNLSVLVLLQGFENAALLLQETHYFGAGFQQFGIFGGTGDLTERMGELGEGALNLRDGGSTASKLVGEFGAIGILAIIVYLCLFIATMRQLRRSGRNSAGFQLLMMCCFYTFSVELFARGVGYFSPTAFLALCSSLFIITHRALPRLKLDEKTPSRIRRQSS